MTRALLIIAVLGWLFVGAIFGQVASFDNGEIGIELNDFGRIRVHAPSIPSQQIDRSSLLVGTSPGTVFNYNTDADSLILATNIASPALSDFELFVACDNEFSGAPPEVIEKVSIFGWNSGGYALARIRVINDEASSWNAVNGVEILPRVDGSYGNETVRYLSNDEVVSIFKSGGTYIGYKFFEPAIASLRSFEWYDGYDDVDDSLYTWLTYGAFDQEFNAGADGAVAIMGQDPVTIAPGDSAEIFLGIAVGTDEATMLTNMSSAENAYITLFTAISQTNDIVPRTYQLKQNYPNPFNPETTIEFNIPQREKVTLKIFNILGKEVATLVDESLTAGNYHYEFNALNLPTGVYFYRFSSGKFTDTRKMLLMK